MCGLVGVIGALTYSDVGNFINLLKLDTIRGHHSTGITRVGEDKSCTIDKWVGTPYVYQGDLRTKIGKPIALLGHNRYATKGEVNLKNAHPFNHGHITGAHNGTLRGQYRLDDWQKFEVDSENIFHHMSRHGAEATVKALDGAFALTWYDATTSTVNLLRNEERPLHVGVSKGGIIYYSSEEWMMQVALGKDLKKTYSLPVGQMMSVELDEKGIKDVTTKEVEFYQPPKYTKSFTSYVGGGGKVVDKPDPGTNLEFIVYTVAPNHIDGRVVTEGPYKDRVVRCYPIGPTEKEMLLAGFNTDKVFSGTCCVQNPSSVHILLYSGTVYELSDDELSEMEEDDCPTYYDENGLEVTKEEWLHLTAGGCAWCTSPVAKPHDAVWIGKGDFVCLDCATLPEVKQYISFN